MSDTIYPFNVGKFQCYAFSDGCVFGQADKFFVGPSASELAHALAEAELEADKIPSWFTPLLVDTGSHRILIDTGVGEQDDPAYGNLLNNLATLGIERTSIDFVIITHAHADHIAACADADNMPNFPQARYVISRVEWEDWTAKENLAEINYHTPHIRKHLMGLADKFELIEAEGELVAGVNLVFARGHTLGQLAVHIYSQDEHLIFAADAMLNPLHLRYPEWNYHSDMDKPAAVQTRRKLAELAVQHQALLLGHHFPFPALGHVTPLEHGWEWQAVTLR